MMGRNRALRYIKTPRDAILQPKHHFSAVCCGLDSDIQRVPFIFKASDNLCVLDHGVARWRVSLQC